MTTRCPECFFDLATAPRALRCVNPACTEVRDDVASDYAGVEVRARPLWERPLKLARGSDPRCPGCGARDGHDACPRCRAYLPAGWAETTTICLALAGARTTGKSIYIAVMIKQLELMMVSDQLGGSLVPANPWTARTFAAEYESRLYEDGEVLRATHKRTADAYQRFPLTFELGRLGRDKRRHVLVLRDVAGEDLESPDAASPRQLGFFGDADAVIFLFDPLRLSEVRSMLAGHVQVDELGGDPVKVLSNLLSLMKAAHGQVKAPLAVTIAKFDAMHLLADVENSDYALALGNPGASFNREGDPNAPAYDEEDGQLLDAEVFSLLSRLGSQNLLNLISHEVADRRFFAVSALGASPLAARTLNDQGLTPYRCLDPVKWAMHRANIIPAAT